METGKGEQNWALISVSMPGRVLRVGASWKKSHDLWSLGGTCCPPNRWLFTAAVLKLYHASGFSGGLVRLLGCNPSVSDPQVWGGTENLHFWQVPTWCPCSCLGTVLGEHLSMTVKANGGRGGVFSVLAGITASLSPGFRALWSPSCYSLLLWQRWLIIFGESEVCIVISEGKTKWFMWVHLFFSLNTDYKFALEGKL